MVSHSVSIADVGCQRNIVVILDLVYMVFICYIVYVDEQ